MSDVSALESQLDQAQQAIERRDRVLKLYENKEFKTLILEDFMRDECARYVHTSGDPSLKPEQRADALALAQAAGHLKRFLAVVVRMGDHAAGQMESIRDAINEARSEEV